MRYRPIRGDKFKMKSQTQTRFWLKGVVARYLNQAVDCPYTPNSIEAYFWWRGYQLLSVRISNPRLNSAMTISLSLLKRHPGFFNGILKNFNLDKIDFKTLTKLNRYDG